MKPSPIAAFFLDPIGGDVLDHPQRRLRLNMRRIELLAMVALVTALMEAVFSFQRESITMFVLSAMTVVSVLAFAFVARHAQKQDRTPLRLLPEAFIVYLLLSSQAAGYVIAQSGRMATGYGLTYLACAVLFLLSPRRFAIIGLVTFALYAAWVSVAPITPFYRVNNIANTALALATAMFGRWSLHRLERIDEDQKRQIARQNEDLAETNRQLLARDGEQKSLMAIAAHDLRSPLYGLGNLLDLAAARPPASQDGWHELLRQAGSSVTAMLALIGRVLQSHEAETVKLRQLEPRNIRQAIEAAMLRADATASHSGVAVQVMGPVVHATVDPDALDQVLDNLLSNAIRFSPPGSVVILSVGSAPLPFVEVVDQGIGVPPEERSQLFGKFRRGSVRPLNGARGSGLGLYIVRTLSEAMGACASYRPGEEQGSVFRIDFSAPSKACLEKRD